MKESTELRDNFCCVLTVYDWIEGLKATSNMGRMTLNSPLPELERMGRSAMII